jgi:hypothetical protein
MVRARKDALESIGIEHVFLTGERNEFCAVLELGAAGKWAIAPGGPWEGGEAVLNVKYRGAYLCCPVKIEKRDDFSYWALFPATGAADSGGWPSLWESIETLENDERLWDTRKGERFGVGAEFSAALGLKKAEQKAVISGREYPCMINDVSFRGMRLTALDGGGAGKGDGIAVLLDFAGPAERIALRGTVQAVITKTGARADAGGRYPRFAVISMRFSAEPPLAFMKRLGAFIERGGL